MAKKRKAKKSKIRRTAKKSKQQKSKAKRPKKPRTGNVDALAPVASDEALERAARASEFTGRMSIKLS